MGARSIDDKWRRLRHLLGFPEHATSWRDRAVATLVAGLGIAFVVAVSSSTRADGSAPSLWLVGSIGATAVLVFGVPHGPLSQPWSVIGGHGVSAVWGIAVAHLVGGGTAAKALAVGGAIGIMHICRCIHPPGGATALGAVLMVAPGHDPSWLYPLTPVLLNATLIVAAAIVLNAPFAWRRYPLALAFRHPHDAAGVGPPPPPFTAEQLRIALGELDTVVTVSDEELELIYRSLQAQQSPPTRGSPSSAGGSP